MKNFDLSWEEFTLVLLGCMFSAVVVFAITEELGWVAHKKEFDCVKTGASKTEILMVYNAGLKTVAPTPITKDEWKCADGVYWR